MFTSDSAAAAAINSTTSTTKKVLGRYLSTRVFETRTETKREHFASQDSGVSQIFILTISNGEKILNKVNVVV